jgi:N-methylhydantoinase B
MRDPEHVMADVRFGYVSAERAYEGYGVVSCPDGSVDVQETSKLRSKLKQARLHLSIVADENMEQYVGDKGRRRIGALSGGDALRLGVGHDDLIEFRGRHPAPLRAWVRIVPAVEGVLSLDAFGRNVLGVEHGDKITVRKLSMPNLPNGLSR